MSARPISFFTNSLHLGGTALVIYEIAAAMMAKGIPVEVVLIRREGEYVPRFQNAGIPIVSLGSSSRNALPVRALAHYIRTHRPVALIAMGGFRNATAIIASMIAGGDTQIVISEHGIPSYATLNPKRSFATKTLFLLAYRLSALLLYRFADKAMANSRHTALQMEKLGWLKAGSVEAVYNPVVSASLLQKADAPCPHPWLEHGQDKVVLAAGRLHPVKDFVTLITAFHVVRQRMACKLIILGNGPEKDKLAALIAALHLENDVCMAGFTDNPYAYMRHASMFVLSSKAEGLSNVLIEAMACGCQLIATDCPGGVREVLDNGAYGRLVPVGDAAALADAIGKTLTGEHFVPSSVLAGAAERFSVQQSLSGYEKLLALPSLQKGI